MASPSVTPVTSRIAVTNATAIQQRVNAAFNFDGTLPQNGAVRADSPLDTGMSIYKYAPLAATGGGLFFWNNLEPLVCSQVHVDLGAAGDITIKLVNLDPAHINDDQPVILAGESITIEAATGVTFIALDEAKIKTLLLPYQAIQIVTNNSTAAQIAQVVASLERTYVR